MLVFEKKNDARSGIVKIGIAAEKRVGFHIILLNH